MASEGLSVIYTESELELLDANCRTAVPFDEDFQLIEQMGRRAKAKRRATRNAAESVEVAASDESLIMNTACEETDCEIPSVKTANSKIPVLQKGYVFDKPSSDDAKSSSSAIESSSASRIPKPSKSSRLVYLGELSRCSTESSEPPSFTPTSGSSFITMITDKDPNTIPANLTPLRKVDTHTDFESLVDETDPNQVVVVAEANGVEMKLDMTAMLKGLNLDFVGLKFL